MDELKMKWTCNQCCGTGRIHYLSGLEIVGNGYMCQMCKGKGHLDINMGKVGAKHQYTDPATGYRFTWR